MGAQRRRRHAGAGRGARDLLQSGTRLATERDGNRRVGGQLGLFGLRAAVLAAREHSPSLARTSLIAFAIADLIEGDIRDVLIGLSLLCYCGTLSGADMPTLFRDAATLAGPAMTTLFQEWAERYPDVQRIGSMGWKEIDTDEGIGFRNC